MCVTFIESYAEAAVKVEEVTAKLAKRNLESQLVQDWLDDVWLSAMVEMCAQLSKWAYVIAAAPDTTNRAEWLRLGSELRVSKVTVWEFGPDVH